MTGPAPDKVAQAAVAASLAIKVAEQLGGLIVFYAKAKGLDEDYVLDYVERMRPTLAQTIHGYCMYTITSMWADRETTLRPTDLPTN